MNTLSMAALSSIFNFGIWFFGEGSGSYHVDDLVSNITASLGIQFGDVSVESLPLGFLLFRIVLFVGGVGLLDQTEVGHCL